MSLHINASKNEIAEIVLLPGDPLRAKFIAENYLENAQCYNQVRNMFGYTGFYKGLRISVQSTGMGIPSFLIYSEELIREYNCNHLIRIGTCGSILPEAKLGDLLIAQAAHTDSNAIMKSFPNSIFAPTANWQLITSAIKVATEKKMIFHVGSVLTSDLFYDDGNDYSLWKNYGALAVEMETAGLYTVAAKHNVKALSLLTVSDEIVTGKKLTALEREKTLKTMFECSLDCAVEIAKRKER
jgi:purine-nucleoside phosphorylase